MKDLICIVCPRGCQLKAEVVDGKLVSIEGNSCVRGKTYALNELTNPTRMVTSTVAIESNELKRLPVMTDKPISKNLIFKAMEEINKVIIKAPVKIGDIVIKNILSTDVNIVATRNVLN
ncbi:MAG: DUF1667 domain-containing protein [Bacilli bacterium]|nr:DUF1667 domain-containing protein [Bacilli bacterium]